MMSGNKNLNHETTRTLRKTLGIPVQLCTLINRYKRRMGCFKQMDELWRIPGMNRKYFDLINDSYTVTAPGKSPTKKKLKPFSWSTIVKPGDSDSGADSRSFPSLRDRWRKIRQTSPKPGTSGLKPGNYMVESVQMAPSCTSDPQFQSLVAINMKKSPDRKGIKGKVKGKTKGKPVAAKLASSPFSFIKSMAPVHISEVIEDQRQLLVPINVQQSPSGDRLCIIYSCSPQKISSTTKDNRATVSNAPVANNPAGSRSPSILKKGDKPPVTKSDLEEPRTSPEKDKHVEFSLKRKSVVNSSSGSYESARCQTRVTDKTKDRVYEADEEVKMEAYVTGDPNQKTSRPVNITVASGAKVSEWIKSNKDFMKIPEIKESTVVASSSSRINTVDGRGVVTTREIVTKEWITPGRHGSPRRFSKDKEIIIKHRPVPKAIESLNLDRSRSPRQDESRSPRRDESRSPRRGRKRSPRRRRSRSSSPVNATDPGDVATINHRTRREAVDPRTRGEASRGYRFYRKRHVRETSKEKTIHRRRRKKRDKEAEDQSCTVI